MALGLTVTAVTLIYLSAIPVHLAVCLRLDGGFGFGFGISAFEPRFALRQAKKRRDSGKKPPAFWKKISIPDALKSGLDALRTLKGHIHLERARLSGRFGAPDAALTAMVCGGAAALNCAIGPDVHILLTPDFSGQALRAELNGMICIRVGHIMLAAFAGAAQYGKRRIQKWKNIPSKAS